MAEDKLILSNEGNQIIYVVDTTPLYNRVDFWVLEVEDKPRSWRVVTAYEYVGGGMVKEQQYRSLLLTSYNKNDKRVFLKFEDAQAYAVERMKGLVDRLQETLSKCTDSLEKWQS